MVIYIQTIPNSLYNVVLCVRLKLWSLMMPRDKGNILYHQNIIECSVNLDKNKQNVRRSQTKLHFLDILETFQHIWKHKNTIHNYK